MGKYIFIKNEIVDALSPVGIMTYIVMANRMNEYDDIYPLSASILSIYAFGDVTADATKFTAGIKELNGMGYFKYITAMQNSASAIDASRMRDDIFNAKHNFVKINYYDDIKKILLLKEAFATKAKMIQFLLNFTRMFSMSHYQYNDRIVKASIKEISNITKQSYSSSVKYISLLEDADVISVYRSEKFSISKCNTPVFEKNCYSRYRDRTALELVSMSFESAESDKTLRTAAKHADINRKRSESQINTWRLRKFLSDGTCGDTYEEFFSMVIYAINNNLHLSTLKFYDTDTFRNRCKECKYFEILMEDERLKGEEKFWD